MPSLPFLAGAAGFCALLAVATLAPPPAAGPEGHLVLQIEGDARALRVTRITPKPDPCGPARLDSIWRIVVRAADGSELGRYPLDLRQFDLDVAHVGAPLRVEGCRVIETGVATLASIPRWPNAASLAIVSGARTLGTLDAPSYAALLAGEVR
jgi:hypothetical protein